MPPRELAGLKPGDKVAFFAFLSDFFFKRFSSLLGVV